MIYDEVLTALHAQANSENVAGMARFGITSTNTLGIAIPNLRKLAKEIGKSHELALQLWQSGIHEARILASFIDIPAQVTEEQMEAWVKDFDSWDVCDQVCGNLFDRTGIAHRKAVEWCHREEEFTRRAGFAMIAYLAVHDKAAFDGVFSGFFPLIERYSTDPRNFVKKAVNWALCQVGKRSPLLCSEAMVVAEHLANASDKTARWVGKDALRELGKR